MDKDTALRIEGLVVTTTLGIGAAVIDTNQSGAWIGTAWAKRKYAREIAKQVNAALRDVPSRVRVHVARGPSYWELRLPHGELFHGKMVVPL